MKQINKGVGERVFKSKSYIAAFLKNKDPMYDGNVHTTAGYISGEVKVGITLRILSGGTALDLGVLFHMRSNHCHKILYEVLLQWIIKNDMGNINIDAYLFDVGALTKVSNGFARLSNGILKGAIGAIYGWLERIIRPSLWIDLIKNPTSFFSRKELYALDAQCIVDHQKRVI